MRYLIEIPHFSILVKEDLIYDALEIFLTSAAGEGGSARYRGRGTDTKNLLYRIFSYVEQRYADECTLAGMAEELGYDYSYLSRYFKKAVGISFNEYVNHYRLSQACYLLDNSDRPILQCAMESGFSSIRSFNRNFKEQFGIAPVQYRKKQS